jgi:hypothetical protein
MDTRRLIPILEEDRNHRPVLFLSTGSLGFPLVVERNINYGSSFLHLWILPDLYLEEIEASPPGQQLKYHAAEVMDPAERDLINRVYSDLARHPLFIVVDAEETKFGFRETLFDLEEYFQTDRRIKDIWSEYRQIYSDSLFHVYKLTDNR